MVEIREETRIMKIRDRLKTTAASVRAIQLKINVYITMIKVLFTVIEVTKIILALIVW